jgi:peptidyl-prolyl cis-trans isomerase C
MIRITWLAAAVFFLGSAQAALAAAADAGTVVASRGGVQVTFGDVDEFVQRVPADKRAAAMDSPRRIEALLLNMLLNKQLARQAEDKGLGNDPEAKGTTGWRRVEVLSRLRMQQFMNSIKVPDLEPLAREEYIGHKDQYLQKGAVDIQRIFISSKQRDRAQTLERATDVQHQASADPGAFDALVMKYSDEADKAQTRGIVKDVYNTKPDQRLRIAVDSLHEPGAISDPFPADGGYQVLKLLSVAPSRQKTFEEVHEQILGQLKSNFIEAQRRDLVDNLGSEKLDANPEAVAALRTRYASARPVAPAQAPQDGPVVINPRAAADKH